MTILSKVKDQLLSTKLSMVGLAVLAVALMGIVARSALQVAWGAGRNGALAVATSDRRSATNTPAPDDPPTTDADDRPTAGTAPEQRATGVGRSVPGPDGWLTYTDPSQVWQLDVPAPFHEVSGGDGVTSLMAIDGDLSFGIEWTPAAVAVDLHAMAEGIMGSVSGNTGWSYGTEVSEVYSSVEPTTVGTLEAVRFSADLGVGPDLLRHSGVVFQINGEIVSAYVLDYGGAGPLEADRYLSSLRTLT